MLLTSAYPDATEVCVVHRTGVKGFQKLMSDTWTAGRRRMANGALTPERAISPARQQDKRLGHSRGSSPLPTSPKSESEDASALSDDALQRRSPSARWPAALARALLCANMQSCAC